MLVAVIEMVGAQSRIQVMHQRDVGRVVKRGAFRNQTKVEKNTLGALMTLFSQKHLTTFFIQRKVTWLDDPFAGTRVFLAFLQVQQGNHSVDCNVKVSVVFRLTADDERRACFVDQDGIHFIDDGVIQATLNTVR